MIFEADVGNSAVKWRVLQAGESASSSQPETIAAGAYPHIGIDLGSAAEQQTFAAQTKGLPIRQARIACVAGANVLDALVNELQSTHHIVPKVATTQHCHAGLTIAYQDPARLGVDRWLAMLAALYQSRQPDVRAGKQRAQSSRAGNLCVIDCGSAITVDVIDGQGQHLGGYIVPGQRLQLQTLLQNTSDIHLREEVDAVASGLGASTETAVMHGVRRMLKSFIASLLAEQKENTATVYLTGGDAEALVQGLAGDVALYHRPNLVLDGLSIALPS